jgi:26S proteasome regulatory subunit N1
LHRLAGAGYVAAPSCARGPAVTDPDRHQLHDVCAQALKVPSATLRPNQGHLRPDDRRREQGSPAIVLSHLFAFRHPIVELITYPPIQAFTADILSLLATTFEHAGKDCLQYRLVGSKDALTSWGHEYVRHLQGQIAEEYKQRQEEQGEGAKLDDLMALAEEIVPYCVTHNAEADACDLLMEIERMDLLEQHVDSKCYDRVCLYLLSCVPFVAEPEDTQLLRTCLSIFRKFSKWPQAMQMALKLNEMDAIKAVFRDCTERPIRRQLAFMLGRQQLFFDVEEELEGLEEEDDELEVLTGLISNVRTLRLRPSLTVASSLS